MTTLASVGPEPRRGSWLDRAVWIGALSLSLIGISAAIYRASNVADASTRGELLRTRALAALGARDLRDWAVESRAVDARFAAHPRLILLHVVSGALYLAFAPLQFWSRLRNRHRNVHRWSGRLLLCALALSTVPALYFGVRMPFGGGGEALIIAIVALLLLTGGWQGYRAIRRRAVARHRQWMIRVFALALAISTVRLVAMALDVALLPLRPSFTTVFVMSLWVGWVLTVGTAEWWIAHTRAGSLSAPGA